MKSSEIIDLAELLREAGLTVYNQPKYRSVTEETISSRPWDEYRFKIAEKLYKYNVRIIRDEQDRLIKELFGIDEITVMRL